MTREVTAPEGAGLTEVIVSPMPPYTLQSSLSAEGNDNIRVLSVRFRTRAIAEDTREEVRKLDAQIKTLTTKQQTIDSDLKATGENLKLLDKLEGFTAKSLEHLTDKGQLDTEKIIALAKFVQEDRTKRTKEQLLLTKQQFDDIPNPNRVHQAGCSMKRAGGVGADRAGCRHSRRQRNKGEGPSGSIVWQAMPPGDRNVQVPDGWEGERSQSQWNAVLL